MQPCACNAIVYQLKSHSGTRSSDRVIESHTAQILTLAICLPKWRSFPTQVETDSMRQQLSSAAVDIYSILSEQITGPDSDQVISTLRDACCIWVGDRFVVPKATALSCPLDVRPYIEPVPEEMEPFRDLFITFGVRIQPLVH